MICTSVYLYQKRLDKDNIGQELETITKREVPIIKVEDIYSNEFYEANAQGYKPSLRLRMSELNYDNEQELEYRGIVYNVVRTQTPNIDEIILICERKSDDIGKGGSK